MSDSLSFIVLVENITYWNSFLKHCRTQRFRCKFVSLELIRLIQKHFLIRSICSVANEGLRRDAPLNSQPWWVAKCSLVYIGHYSLAPALELLKPGYPCNTTFFLKFYDSEQAKMLHLESKVCQKYSPGTAASAEACVINSNRMYCKSVSAPLLVT